MMMRVKLVIMSSSDGSTVSRLISTRIWSDSDSGRPSPEMAPSARLRAPLWPPAGEVALGVPVAGVPWPAARARQRRRGRGGLGGRRRAPARPGPARLRASA